MIVTHPFLFNSIVVFFIAFTAGWMVYVITGRHARHLSNRLQKLEQEKEQLRLQAEELEEQLEEKQNSNFKTAPVIALSSSPKNNKAGDLAN